ncbi:MAG TPA: SDR family oxidoreductase [bacterium]|nr:SDR family oxidoreductase [bacterium]
MEAGVTRTALVTGAAGGIGHAIVRALLAAGWHVAATDRAAADLPPDVAFVTADLAAPEGADVIVRALQSMRRLDALVNNAAVQLAAPLLQTTAAEWDEIMAVNVRAAALLARATFPLLRIAGGSVVNVASVHAVATSVDLAAYAASKGALVALTRAMAIEFAPAGVRVNAVLPGAVDTPMLRAGLRRGHLAGSSDDERIAALGARTVLGRVGRPDEIAEAVLFLADGARSSFITGQALIVDGGATARLSTE